MFEVSHPGIGTTRRACAGRAPMNSRSQYAIAKLVPCFALSLAQTGPQNMVLYLDCAGDGVDGPSKPALDFQAAHAFEAWGNDRGGAGAILSKDGYDWPAYSFGATAAGLGVLYRSKMQRMTFKCLALTLQGRVRRLR